VPKTYFYTLRVPSAPLQPGDPKTNLSLAVERFRTAEILRDDRIVFYKSPTEVGFYQYHRWSADPGTMLTERTARWLDQTGIFSQVRISPPGEPVDYILKGRLLNFEEVDYEDSGKGRVALRLALVRSRDGRTVWSFARQAEHAIEEKGIEGVVIALDASSADLLGQALPSLVQQVERDFSDRQQQPR
jgi:ABC-type uncharacterized transport system auxiliary subunit